MENPVCGLSLSLSVSSHSALLSYTQTHAHPPSPTQLPSAGAGLHKTPAELKTDPYGKLGDSDRFEKKAHVGYRADVNAKVRFVTEKAGRGS